MPVAVVVGVAVVVVPVAVVPVLVAVNVATAVAPLETKLAEPSVLPLASVIVATQVLGIVVIFRFLIVAVATLAPLPLVFSGW